ncbi:hypothetical protein Pan216_47120 [Planctomycetes bacterium Pan216]|uniref:DUF420 domain-containing protein n=1 Tax=Kolteria novifilia TaxID=2527975 RepID=A0A518BA27_9BACT|nr:hypothetical protein Pan216_47120 [Planctomycetes bacterium Pan216]
MMPPGFIPFSRASFMLDVVATAMVAILPVLTWSIYLVKARQNYLLHKRVQVTTGVVLLLAVILFELDIRIYGWRHLATESPYYDTILFPFLYFHVTLACLTTLLWIVTIAGALRRFASPPVPGPYSSTHKWLGWSAAIGMYFTGVTGWTFYWMAFIATK